MHLLLAAEVNAQLQLGNEPDLLLGAIAPDAAKDKRCSHYKTQPHPYAYNSPLDWGQFVIEYRDEMHHPFYIGYLTHLIMDDIWTMKTDFSGFEQRIKIESGLYERYHGDLWLCNAKLIEAYDLHALHDVLLAATDVPATLSALDKADVLAYKQSALEDFKYPKANLTKPLELFTFEDMIHYVERCKSKALDTCRMLDAIGLLR